MVMTWDRIGRKAFEYKALNGMVGAVEKNRNTRRNRRIPGTMCPTALPLRALWINNLQTGCPTHHAQKPTTVEKPMNGYVYFIANHDESVVKIGFASDVRQRLADLQTGTHHTLNVECSIPAPREAERLILQRFKKYRIRGEWFRLASEIEDLWDDLFDYQGLRLFTGGVAMRQRDRMDTEPVDLEELTFLLSNIGGGKWPDGFPRSVPPRTPAPEAPEPTEFDKETIRL